MLSRVANSIYWMNRYLERAENYARFIDANLNLTLDLPPGMAEQWAPLIQVTGDEALFREQQAARGQSKQSGESRSQSQSQAFAPDFSREAVLRFLIEQRGNPSSIRSCIFRARENARSIREMLSLEIWEQLNEFYLRSREAVDTPDALAATLADPLPFCRLVREQCHLFYGLFSTTLSHGEGWHFGALGRQLERADQTTRLLDVKYFILLPRVEDVGRSFDLLQWSSVLKSASAFEMYTRVFDRIEPRLIIRFLLFDRHFPRSISFCVARAGGSLEQITGSRSRSFANTAEKNLGRLRSELEYSEIGEVFDVGLHEYLDRLQLRLNDIGLELEASYFRSDI